MSRSFSLEQLSDYITDQIARIAAVRKEVEEIQVGFNSAYVEWQAEHDAALERLTEAVMDRRDEVGPDLEAQIQERIGEERHIIDARREELRDELIPEAQAQADRTLAQGQRLTETVRELNPRLNDREETLKAQRAALEEELAALNDQIRELSGCLGVVTNFVKINRLDRQRQRAIGKLDAIQQELKAVREEWQATYDQIKDQQEGLQDQWQELTLELARLQGELDYLDDETSREDLALKRAVRFVIDHLKQPVACPAQDLERQLADMVELNIETDTYQEGLGSVSGVLSVLDGITEGLHRFDESVKGLIREQQMHSSYLSKLSVTVPSETLAFHEQWDDLRGSVKDERHLGANPAEFIAAVRPVMEENMSEARIVAMFNSLAGALEQATAGWRG
jgi:DNA repair exonuclease SbcCD ATPase subunit